MWEYIIRKYKEIILFTIGSLLIVLSLSLALYSRVELIKEQVFSEIDFLIENEKNKEEVNNQEDNEQNGNNNEGEIDNSENNTLVDINTEYVDDTNNVEENEQTGSGNSSSNDNAPKKVYIGYLEIPRISLKYGFVAKDSYYNHVDRNIQIIKEADFPDVENGNFIIAGHSGNAKISYFKNLFLLKEGDIAKVTYNNKIYTYKITSIYKEDRDGTILIKRDVTKTTLTLITCSYKDKKHQTVYIAELISVS